MRVMRTTALAIAMGAVTAAQQFLPVSPGAPVDPNTRFDVVVIKPIEDSGSPTLMRMTPGGFESSVPIGILLRQALQKADYEMAGAPGWINTDRYSIRAKASAAMPPGAIPVLLLNLLKDRFQLATHLETREQPIAHLVMARADGRLGPDLKPTPADCQTTLTERQEAAKRGSPPPPLPGMPGGPPLPGLDDPVPCGFGRISFGMVALSGRTMAQLAPTLSGLVARPVIDKTGLTGLHDISLKFAYEGQPLGPMGAVPLPGTPAAAVDPNAPSLSAALQEQLGLKLENTRGPVEVVVIDKLEKPTLD